MPGRPALRAPTVIDEAVVGKREQESAEFRARFVARAIHDHAAPDFLEQIVGDFAVARLAHEIAIQRAAMTRVESLEGAHLAARVREHQLRVFVVTHDRDSTRGSRAREARRRFRSSEAVHRDGGRIHGCITSPSPACEHVAAPAVRAAG